MCIVVYVYYKSMLSSVDSSRGIFKHAVWITPSGQVHDFRPRVFFTSEPRQISTAENIQRGLHCPSGINRVIKVRSQFEYYVVFTSISTEKLSHSFRTTATRSKRQERGAAPCSLLKLRWMGTQRVQMRRVLSFPGWFVGTVVPVQ